jgi:porin
LLRTSSSPEVPATGTARRRGDGKRALCAAALGALLLVVAAVAAADDERERPSLLEQKNLTGDWGGWRPRLAEHGVAPYLVYTGSMWSNLAGGIRRGTELDGYLDLGIGLDLEKLGMWRGLELQVSAHWFQGRRPSAELVGVDIAQAVNPWEASNAIRFYNVYLSQRFGAGGVVRVGQMAADADFMITRYGATMLNASFGDLPSQNANLDVPVYPLAAPGVYTESPLGGDLRGRLGLYTADAGVDEAGNHGFEWKLGNQAGYALFAELAADASPLDLPATYTLGGYFTSVRLPQLDGTGFVYALWSTWLMVDQALRVDAQGDPVVGVFARFSYSPDDDNDVIGIYADAGLNVFGPIPGRPDDVFAFAGGVGRFTGGFRRYAGSANPFDHGGEAVLELTYQIAATPWLAVQPDLQYVIDPVAADDDATVVGMEIVVTF